MKMVRSQVLSEDRRHRYLVSRRWSRGKRVAMWLLLHPEPHQYDRDDGVVGRCIALSLDSFDALVICSVFSLIAPSVQYLEQTYHLQPAVELVQADAHNREFIRSSASSCSVGIVAWGNTKFSGSREFTSATEIMLAAFGKVSCLGRTMAGEPRAPSFVSRRHKLEPFCTRTPS